MYRGYYRSLVFVPGAICETTRFLASRIEIVQELRMYQKYIIFQNTEDTHSLLMWFSINYGVVFGKVNNERSLSKLAIKITEIIRNSNISACVIDILIKG